MWLSFNCLIIIIQDFNAFDVKVTALEPFIWVLILLGHPVVYCLKQSASQDQALQRHQHL